MQVEIEHLSSLVRFRSVAGSVGDPFDFSITVRWLSPTRVEFMGVDKYIPRAAWRPIKDAFAAIGVLEILAQRYKRGRLVQWRIKTERKRRDNQAA